MEAANISLIPTSSNFNGNGEFPEGKEKRTTPTVSQKKVFLRLYNYIKNIVN